MQTPARRAYKRTHQRVQMIAGVRAVESLIDAPWTSIPTRPHAWRARHSRSMLEPSERAGSPRKAATIFSAYVVREYELKFSLKNLNTLAVECLEWRFFGIPTQRQGRVGKFVARGGVERDSRIYSAGCSGCKGTSL
jgi:hypothetical protein